MGRKGKNKKNGGSRNRQQQQQQQQEQRPRLVAADDDNDNEILDDSEDEEIPEDEAFNSDDERKYGAFFQGVGGGGSDDDDDSSEDDSDDDDDDESAMGDSDGEDDGSEEGDGGQYMLDLLNKLDGGGDGEGKKRGGGREDAAAMATSSVSANAKESEFSSSVVPKAGLTIDDLMKDLEGTKGYGTVQRAMRDVARGASTPAPLARVAADRTKRRVHYEDQAKEVSQWLPAVQHNRQAETLDFRPKGRVDVTRDALVEKFVPTTDFEKEIHAALEKAGQKDEEAMLQAEEDALKDDLGANGITLEEYRERRGQLAKMRSLLFSYEQKRHHMKKIKSKKYRRIRKRQREREREAELEADAEEDPELVMREMQEKEEVERMKERMTLAHKNTSKWAKRVLKRGKNVDADTRKALSAQLKRGDDLLQRMRGTRAGGGGGGSDSEGDEEDLAETARKVLADDGDDGAGEDAAVKGKGLFKLSFMQKGIERQRQKAKEEARQLLQELEADDYPSDDDEGQEDGAMSDDGEDGPRKKGSSAKRKVASKKEMEQVLGEGELVVSQLKQGTSNNAVSVSGAINIDSLLTRSGSAAKASGQATESDKAATAGAVSIHTATINVQASSKEDEPDPSALSPTKLAPGSQKKKAAHPAVGQRQEEGANPWLVEGQQKPFASESKAKRSSNKGGYQPYMVDVERAIDLLEPAATKTQPDKKVDSATEEEKLDEVPRGQGPANASPNDSIKITTLSQEELVKRAFATAAEKEEDEEFAREKEAVEEEEESPNGKRKNQKGADGTVAGWGSWAGKGAPPPRPPRKLPKRLQPPEKKLPKRKRVDEKKPNVIISEKRVKRTADNFMLAQVPYPFSSREEYERSMSGGVGREWNVTSSFKDMTRPEIITRAGKVIQPLSKKVKQKRPAAKF